MGATFLTSTGSVSLPLCVSSSVTVTPMVLVSLAVLLPGARPSSRYWCWTLKATWPVRPLIDVIVSTAESVDELNVSPTLSVAMPAAFAQGRDRERRVGRVVGVVPVDGERVGVQQADVGVLPVSVAVPFSSIMGTAFKGHGRGHVVDQYRLGVAAALRVVVEDA